jgi:MFS family permease
MVDVPAPKVASLPAAEAHAGRFEALRFRDYRILWISSTFIFFGIQAQQIARGWLAVELSGTNAGLGGVFLAFGVPMLIFGPIGGVLADRFSKRSVLNICQATLLAAALLVAIGETLNFLEYWMLLVSSVVHGGSISVLAPTRMAFTGELVARPMLPNAVMLQQLGINGTRVIGPAIAGALVGIQSIGPGGVFWFTSVLIAIAMVITVLLPYVAPRRRATIESPTAELVDGVRYVRSRAQVMLLMVSSTIVVAVGMTYLAFLPTVARDIFDVGSQGYGTMSAVGAVAAVAASFWIAGRVYRTSVWHLQSVFGVALSVSLVLLAIAPTYGIALAVLAALGGATAGYQSSNNSLVLTETELEYHGRVQSLMMTGYALSGMLALPLGVIADAFGLRQTLAGMGVVCLATMIWYILARRRDLLREEDLTF